ncbi:tetratricopeptide repeat protein, partial [Kosmotoga sp.]|uniref:tetratricopeptide repeat protein n=1 Tax=Kosmotoga sp. TaxID=1955248 RepID=UPI00345B5782
MMQNNCRRKLRHLAKAINYTSAFSLRSELRDIFLYREKFRECFPFAIALDIFVSKSFDRQPVSEQISISYKPEEALQGIFELTKYYTMKNMGMHAYMAAALGMDVIKKHKVSSQFEIPAKYYKMMTAFELGFSDEAIKYYNELLLRESEIPDEIKFGYYNALGLISAQFPSGDQKAREYYAKATEQACTVKMLDIVKINFADYYYGRENFEKALELLNEVTSTNYASVEGYLNTLKLKIYLQASHDDECKAVVEKLEEINSKKENWTGNWRSFIFLGHYYAKINNYAKASYYLEKLKNVEDFKFNS